MKNIYPYLLSLSLILLSAPILAQPTVDICVENSGTDLAVKIQPDAAFSGFVSNIQMTIECDDPSVTFGAVSDILVYIPMAKAGATTVSTGAAHQKFAGFGGLPMTSFGASWASGEVITLFKIVPSDLSATFTVSVSGWTMANNGVYYVELNALDKTGTILDCGSFLPVEGLNFQAEKIPGQGVGLDWQTLTEQNSDYFSVEKRRDGGEFSEIAKVGAAGFSQVIQEYHYLDQSEMGFINDYRLKVVDMDGSFIYSDLQTVLWDGGEIGAFYPSPADQSSQIQISSATSGTIELQFFNLMGQQISTYQQGMIAGVQSISVPLGRLASGLYQVKILLDGQWVSTREIQVLH